MTLAQFPLLSKYLITCILSGNQYTCKLCLLQRFFTLSFEAAIVFVNAPEIPPAKKSNMKFDDPLVCHL